MVDTVHAVESDRDQLSDAIQPVGRRAGAWRWPLVLVAAVVVFAGGYLVGFEVGDDDGGTAPVAALPDGRYATFLTGVTTSAVELDVVQWLTGDEARAAWLRDHPEEPGGPPNDYYVVNDDLTVREVEVDPSVEVRLVRLSEDGDADLDPGTFAELPAYLDGQPKPDGPALSYNPFWITITDGTAVEIEEQYIP